MARMGMDVDQVAAAGNALKQRAADIDTLVTKIDGIVRSIPGVWDGPDAQQFINEWWPEHKKTLVAASSHVAGLGQSALNNASEQREVSAVSGGGTVPATPGPGNPAPGTPTLAPQADPVAGSVNQVKMSAWAAGAVGRGYDVDGAYGRQCVDLANEYTANRFGVPYHQAIGGGNYAKDIFANTPTTYFDKIPAAGGAQPGDLVCIDSFEGSPGSLAGGHIAIVESVGSDGTVHVIEQDGNNPSTTVATRGSLSAVEMKAVQGYLRPKS